jgi:hypothetical protein
MSKLFTDVYHIVETETTDDSGLASFSVDNRIIYTFHCTKTGYLTKDFSIRITSTDTISFQMGETTTTYVSLANGITYRFSPNMEAINNNTDYNFQFVLDSSYWSLANCTLFLKNTTTTFNQSSSAFNSSHCDITIPFNTGNLRYLKSEAEYYINGTRQVVSVEYSIQNNYQGDFSLMTVFNDINAFDGAGFNASTRAILGLLLIILIVGGITYKMEVYEPEVLLWITFFLTALISWAGWFTINYSTIPEIAGLSTGWLKKYILLILVFIITVGYTIRRHSE